MEEAHCVYFPRDYPTDEEVAWYKDILDRGRKGDYYVYLYGSTQDAIVEWLTDDAMLGWTKRNFHIDMVLLTFIMTSYQISHIIRKNKKKRYEMMMSRHKLNGAICVKT